MSTSGPQTRRRSVRTSTPVHLEDLRGTADLLASDESHDCSSGDLSFNCDFFHHQKAASAVLRAVGSNQLSYLASSDSNWTKELIRYPFSQCPISLQPTYSLKNRSSQGGTYGKKTGNLINIDIEEMILAVSTMTVQEVDFSSTDIGHYAQCQHSIATHASGSNKKMGQDVQNSWFIFERVGARDFKGSHLGLRQPPDDNEVRSWLEKLHCITKFSSECFVISMVYIGRVLNNSRDMKLSCITWRPLLFTSLLIAHKYWDDDYLTNQDFGRGYGNHTIAEINLLERTFLKLLDYNVGILPSAYCRCYFGLRLAVKVAAECRLRQECKNLLDIDKYTSKQKTKQFFNDHAGGELECASLPSTCHDIRRNMLQIVYGECPASDVSSYCQKSGPTDSLQDEVKRFLTVSKGKSSRWSCIKQALSIGGKRHFQRDDNSKRINTPLGSHCSIIRMVLVSNEPFSKHFSNDALTSRIKDPSPFLAACGRLSENIEQSGKYPICHSPVFEPGITSRRKSLSFESLPTLRKGMKIDYHDSSQPPIIGSEPKASEYPDFLSECSRSVSVPSRPSEIDLSRLSVDSSDIPDTDTSEAFEEIQVESNGSEFSDSESSAIFFKSSEPESLVHLNTCWDELPAESRRGRILSDERQPYLYEIDQTEILSKQYLNEYSFEIDSSDVSSVH